MEGRDRIDELEAATRSAEFLELLLEQIETQPIAVHRHRHGLRAQPLRRAHHRLPGGKLHCEGVALVEEGLAEERDALHAARGEEQPAPVHLAAIHPARALGQAVAQPLPAVHDAAVCTPTILERGGSVVA